MYKLTVTYQEQGKMSMEGNNVDALKETMRKFVTGIGINRYRAIITDANNQEVFALNVE